MASAAAVDARTWRQARLVRRYRVQPSAWRLTVRRRPRSRASRLFRIGMVVVAAWVSVWAVASVAYAGNELDAMLDALVVAQLTSGGFTFAHAPGTRPEPLTILVRG